MKNMLFVLLSGVLLVLSYPPFDFTYLIFVALVPLFFVLYQKNDFGYIILFIIIVTFSLLFFVIFLDQINIEIKVIICVVLFVWVGLYMYLFSLFLINLSPKKLITGGIIAGVWVVLALLSNKLLNFYWFLFITQYNNYVLLKLGKWLGVFSISYSIIFINFLFFYTLYNNKKIMMLILIICLVVISFGSNKYNKPSMYISDDQMQSNIMIVQPNKSLQEKKGAMGQYKQDLQFYSVFDQKYFIDKDLDFIIWPETVIERWIFIIPDYVEYLKNLSKETGAYLIIGAPDLDYRLSEYNSVFIVSPTGEIERYDKMKKVPLIEDIFKSGDNKVEVNTRYGLIDTLICWESLNMLHSTDANIRFILISDLAMKNTFVPLAHSRLAILNAVENNLAVVVASYTGPSMVINSSGQIVAETPFLRPFLLQNQLILQGKKRKYHHTNVFFYVCFLIGSYFVIRNRNNLIIGPIPLCYLGITILVALFLIYSNFFSMKNLNSKYSLQSELWSSVRRIPAYKINDPEKESIRYILEYYGIYLEKYFTLEQIVNYESTDILKILGLEISDIDLSEINDLKVPLLAKTDDGWFSIIKLDKKQIEVRYPNGTKLKKQIDILKINAYIIRPTYREFDI